MKVPFKINPSTACLALVSVTAFSNLSFASIYTHAPADPRQDTRTNHLDAQQKQNQGRDPAPLYKRQNGLRLVSKKCLGAEFGASGLCTYEWAVKLSLRCDVRPQLHSLAIDIPMRFKNLTVEITGVKPGVLKQKERFPLPVSTSGDGEMQFDFATSEAVPHLKFRFTKNTQTALVESALVVDPVIFDESFCK